MERSTLSLNFWVSPSKARKNGKAPINLTVTLNGQRASMSTHKFIKPADWDAKRQRAKGTGDESQAINEYLFQVKTRLIKQEAALLEHGYILTAKLLKDAYQERVPSLQTKTLCQVFEEYLKDMRKQVGVRISDDSFYSYDRTLTLLKEFLVSELHREDVQLFELTHTFMSNLETFLKVDHHMAHNTAIKHLKCLKHVVAVACDNGFIDRNPIAGYKTPREVVDKPFLTEEELRCIINKDFTAIRLERMRDVFIFACFTGLSYSDVKTLSPSHFFTDNMGRVWIKKHRVKTGVLFRVPLLPVPKLILEKYKGGDTLLPVLNLGTADAYLKEIATLCGIDKNISFHTARFTFATTVTLMNSVSMEVVSKMLGHTTTKMTSHYAKIVDEYIGRDMDRLEEMMDKMIMDK